MLPFSEPCRVWVEQPEDVHFMQMAIDQAKIGFSKGEVREALC